VTQYLMHRDGLISVVLCTVHAAIIAINDAVDRCVAMTTVNCLLNLT